MTVVSKLSLIQLIFTLILSGVVYSFWGKISGASALIGGLICVVSNFFFAGRLFVGRHTEDPKQILRQFYRSEALKLTFVIAMFIIVFTLLDIEFMAFILAYAFIALLNLLCLPFLNE